MITRKQVDKKKWNTYLVPTLIFTVVIIFILSSSGIKMMSDAKEQVTEDYQDEVESICFLYEKEIYALEKAACIMADYVFSSGDIRNEKNLIYIESVAKTINAKNVYIISPDFTAIDFCGEEYIDINRSSIFAETFSNRLSSIRFAKDKDGKSVLVIIKPISSKSIFKGYIGIEYTPDLMKDLLDNPKYTSRKTYALVSSDGSIIEKTGLEEKSIDDGSNIVDYSENYLYISGSYNSFIQAIHDCRSGMIQTVYQEDGKYIYYAPIKGVKGNVIMMVDALDVERSHNQISKAIRSMLIEIGISIIAFIAIFAGISLFNKAKYSIESEDLQNKADTDLLTDLYNKMATERMIKEYLTGEGKDSVSMLFVLDVDNFKKINDTMGHAFGDQVLSQLGHQIRAWFRVNDIVGRIGGDEFMIFIKDVKNPEVVKREGSRIMQFFEGFNVGEYTRYSPTASVGGAVYPNDGTDFESLYKAADKAVYKSKKEGKNRVSFYSDLNVMEKDVVVDKKNVE